MSTLANNRLSVTIDAAVMTQVRNAFSTINTLLPFMIGLTNDERMTLPKMNVVNKQFVTDALHAIENNGSLFPPYINAQELNNDLTVYNQLDELVTLAQQLTEKLRDTQMLAGSEAYVSALTIYRLIESASHAGLPGTDTIYAQLAERFANQGNNKSTTTTTTQQ